MHGGEQQACTVGKGEARLWAEVGGGRRREVGKSRT